MICRRGLLIDMLFWVDAKDDLQLLCFSQFTFGYTNIFKFSDFLISRSISRNISSYLGANTPTPTSNIRLCNAIVKNNTIMYIGTNIERLLV
jgi:hypothetical protein